MTPVEICLKGHLFDMKQLRRAFSLLCILVLLGGFCAVPSYADVSWPEDVSIFAEGGILIDADSGSILYGKNIHNAYYPASITKILTALIVIENCDMGEIVTFSHDAVFNVEAGSSSAALDVGDRLSVRDCLYAMLLRSANEAANALAEHVAGSVGAFAGMMNEKAVSLGCTDSHFNNPSGLNDPEHYTSAYDMALIARAAFQNETFVEIDSTLYYDLPVTKRNPEGFRIYPGHRMLKKNTEQYYPGIIGGKTGYTSLAGNTLVTCAKRDGLKLIAVVLNGHQTHYSDTRALLNFGFENFHSVNVSDIDTANALVENDMTIAGLPMTDLSVLQLEENCSIVLPVDADYREVTSSISYDLDPRIKVPEGAIALISYNYGSHPVGSGYLLLNKDGDSETEPIPDSAKETDVSEAAEEMEDDPLQSRFRIAFPEIHIPRRVIIVFLAAAGTAALAGAVYALFYLNKKRREREEMEQIARNNRRQARLDDIGISVEEFDSLLKEKHDSGMISSTGQASKKRKKGKGPFG